MPDQTTSIETLKLRVKGICEARDWDRFHSPKNLAAGVITEAAELLEHFRWLDDQESRRLLETPDGALAVREELIDVMFFVLRFAQLYDVDLSTEFEKKMLKNEAKYPIEKSARKRKEIHRVLEPRPHVQFNGHLAFIRPRSESTLFSARKPTAYVRPLNT